MWQQTIEAEKALKKVFEGARDEIVPLFRREFEQIMPQLVKTLRSIFVFK